MAYGDFTLERAVSELGLSVQMADLFAAVAPVAPPAWLTDMLARGQAMPLVSEKARSERIVVPILLAVQELAPQPISIFSGQNLKADPDRGLVGECDFILARTPPVPLLSAPLVTIVEAKKGDIEMGLGQCVAQMVGARVFNEKEGHPNQPVHGCVTTGEDWQFLRLRGAELLIDRQRYYIRDLGLVLAVFKAAVGGPSAE